mgnify:CR=1 FL=1
MDKVIFVCPSLKTGGGNRVIIELANQLVLKKISVEIVYPFNSEDKHTFFVNRNVKFKKVGLYPRNKLIKIINVFVRLRLYY